MNVTSIDYHVVPYNGQWAVKMEGRDVYAYEARTQLQAISYGMELAKEAAAMLVIHGRDGRFREVWNYS